MNYHYDTNDTNPKDQGDFIKSQIQNYSRYWIWFALSMFLTFTFAYLYLRYTPKIYTSHAKIKILNKSKGLELPSSAFVFNRSNINLENEIEIIKSYRIIKSVVDSLDLTFRYFEEGNVLTTEVNQLPFNLNKTISNDSIYNSSSFRIEVIENAFEITNENNEEIIVFPEFDTTLKNHSLPFDITVNTPASLNDMIGKIYIVKINPMSLITRGLKSKVNINMLGKNSDLLQLNFSSQSKAKNERILNTLIEVFNIDGIRDRQQVSKRTMDFIDERFEILIRKLDSIEIGIKDYKQENNLITLESDAELGMTERTSSEQELFNIENQLILSDLLKQTLENPSSDSDLLPSNIGLNNSSINNLVDNYNKLIFERDNLKISAGENNPSFLFTNEKLEDIKQNIYASIESYTKQLKASKVQMLDKNKKYASKVYGLPAIEKSMTDIYRQREIIQSLYLFLLQKREEAAINYAITEPSIKVVEDAISNGQPISPNSRKTYFMALMVGLLAPFSIIYMYFLLDTKVKNREDVIQQNSRIPIVGEIPKILDKHIVFKDPEDRSMGAEAFRILSSNINYILPVIKGETGKVIFCTSTIKGEGKTYTSINLSLALSSINKKVLLIGADLRNPQIHAYINEEKQKKGLSNYLHDVSCSWKDVIVKGFLKHPNHDIILSGSIPPNPANLLTNGRFRTLIEEAKKDYDYIIADTAPTLLVTDTMLISQLADATIYLIKSNFTEKKLLNFSKELFESGKLMNMAYVVNSVDFKKSHGYGYNYGYGYGYGENV